MIRLDSITLESVQRVNWQGTLTGLEPQPIGQQFLLMQLCPGFDEASLSPRQRAGHQVDGI